MPWFSSSKDDEAVDHTACVWPPTFQSFEEYKAEFDEAVAAHPPFGIWLQTYRNIKHITDHEQSPMWQLSVQELKQRYWWHAHQTNRTKNAKRAFIEMHLDTNKATYEKDESELRPRMESYALALDSYNQARIHGYHHIPMPKEPGKTPALRERDRLHEELKACR